MGEGSRARECRRVTRGRPSACCAPGAPASAANALRRGSLRRACPFLRLGYLHPARGAAGRGGFCGPFSRLCARLPGAPTYR